MAFPFSPIHALERQLDLGFLILYSHQVFDKTSVARIIEVSAGG